MEDDDDSTQEAYGAAEFPQYSQLFVKYIGAQDGSY